MLKYALKRLATSLVTIFLVIMLTFFLMQMVPGGPFLGENVNPIIIERMLEKYGYDQPLLIQFGRYLRDMVHGDLGYSMVARPGTPVMEVLLSSFPTSAKLGFIALGLALLIGIPLGVLASVKHDTLYDRLFIFLSSMFVSIPSFILTVMLMMVFALWLKLLPVAYLENWKSYILPIAGMAVYPMFHLGRLTRTTMLDAVSQDYVMTARAKGLSTAKIMFKHALRNAIIPVVTSLGPTIAGIMTGSFVVEKVFAIDGMGKYFVNSISSRDYPLIMGTTIFYGALLILCNYVVDLLYGVIDPRIKL